MNYTSVPALVAMLDQTSIRMYWQALNRFICLALKNSLVIYLIIKTGLKVNH